VKVLFNDGQHYLGIIVRKDKEQDKWVLLRTFLLTLPPMRTIHLLNSNYACIHIIFKLAVNHLMSLPIESTIEHLIVMITTQFIADIFAVTVTTTAVHDFVLYTSCTALS